MGRIGAEKVAPVPDTFSGLLPPGCADPEENPF